MQRASLALILALMAVPAEAVCPPGTYLWVDAVGTHFCKRLEAAPSDSTQKRAVDCPTGTTREIDGRGNTGCRSSSGTMQFNDPPAGCPAGTQLWVDTRGNRYCKKI
jgi:hypothetical protein